MRRIAVLGALGGATLVAACVSLAGLSGEAPLSSDGGGAEATANDAAPPDPCRHMSYPAEPATDDDPSNDIGPLVLATRNVSPTGALNAGDPDGYDLDGVCTCFADPATAHSGVPSCLAPDGGPPACDVDGGVDRQLGNFLAGFPDLLGASAAENGGPTTLFKITKYNGRANDKEVFVGVLASSGIFDVSPSCDGGLPDSGAPPYLPTWTGCDQWSVLSTYVLPSTTEPTTYLPAYVTDHVLVVRASQSPVTFVVGNAEIPIARALVTARLVAVDDAMTPIVPPPAVGKLFRMEQGLVAGRMNTTDALRSLAISEAVNDGGPLCGYSAFFGAVKTNFVCPNADMTTNANDDFANAPCDALSLAVGIIAQPASLGAARSPNPSHCADPSSAPFQPTFDCTQ